MTAAQWELTPEQRAITVHRTTSSITNLAFSRGVRMSLDDAHAAASKAEKAAYATAQVESRTTTGSRLDAESLQAYVRKLGNLVLEAAKAAGSQTTDAAATENGVAQQDFLDLSRGERAFLNRELAEDSLAPLLAPNSAITKVKLSSKSFSTEAAELLAQGIANVRGSLVDADLSDIIAGRPEDQALAVLRILSDALAAHGSMEAINLSDNALGEKGVRAFAAGLSSQTALQRVAFQNVGASIKACAAIAELIPNAQALTQLHLFNNMSDDDGAAAIAGLLLRAPAMRDFKMASSRVGAEGAIALAHGLSAGSALEVLDISDNPMTGDAAEALAAMLAKQSGLRALNLSDTALGDEGVSAVLRALHASSGSLKDLNLALNEVTAEGAAAVASFLTGRTGLQRLDLRENELENEGALALAKALGSLGGLQELSLSGNQIRGSGAIAIVRAVAPLPALRSLQLNENEISEAAVSVIESVLAAAGKENILELEDNDPDEDDEEVADDGTVDDIAARLAATGL